AEGQDLSPLASFRLAILPSFTIDTIADMVAVGCVRHGVAADVAVAEFDQIVQTAFDPNAEVFQPHPDAVLLLFDHRWLGFERFQTADADADPVATALDRVASCLRQLREGLGTQAIVSTVAVPPGTLFGSLDRIAAGAV